MVLVRNMAVVPMINTLYKDFILLNLFCTFVVLLFYSDPDKKIK